MRSIAIAILIVGGYIGYTLDHKQPKEQVRASTPSEEFKLRGECARLAGVLERENPEYLTSVAVSWSSTYSSKDNRCYVLEATWNHTNQMLIQILYDGQTKETLASNQRNASGALDTEEGTITGKTTFGCSADSDCHFAETENYIEACMRR